MTTPRRDGDDWLPSGFPPRTFPRGSAPVVPPTPVPPPPREPRPGRGKWLAAAAALLALLLLAAVLILATRGDDDADLSTGTSTSTPLETTTSIDLTTSSIDPVSTTVAGGITTVAATPASPGVLEPATATLALPKADASTGPTRATLALKNTGGTPLTYATSSSSPGLTAAPGRGTIAPGGSTTVTVTLDAARVDGEGPFAGTLSFSGTGGDKAVQVTSTVGRPPEIIGTGPSCEQRAQPCSRQIEFVGAPNFGSNACNTPWVYSVTIDDRSRIQSAGVIARRGVGNADAPLGRVGSSNIFQSPPQPPIENTVTLRFTIGAVDEHGYGRQLAEERISC